ncbi:MAG: Gfo/Idh/MocA family protein, partial [Gaiellaceae bacterium]
MSEGLKVGQVGLGYWGRNLARVFDDEADLTWLCDASEALRDEFGRRHPNARMTGDFDELLAADDVEAVVIATPVPTHYPLARAALEAGKHVFVEKPPAMRAAEMEELIGLAEAGGLVLMPGHLLLYHPGVQKLKELVDSGELGEVLADGTVEAVVIATPVPTHYELARRALEAGKHVFVEKPPAMRAAEMEELVAVAEERNLVLMPGHLLLYHPGVQKLKGLVDSGELGDVLCVYSNRQNLGIIRKDENALWSLGVHDLSVILYLLDEEPSEAVAHGRDFLTEGVEDVVFCYLRFPSGKIAHMHLSWLDPHKMRRMTVVGREKMVVFDDMELERKVTVYEKSPWKR